MKVLERKQDAILPALPSPEQLFELCSRFEVLHLRVHKEGGHAKKIQKKLETLMHDIAGKLSRKLRFDKI